VKVYPESIETVLAAFEGLTGDYRIEVDQEGSTDRLTVICEGRPTRTTWRGNSASGSSLLRIRSNLSTS